MPGTPPSTPPTRFAYLGPEGTFAEAALISAVASSEGARYPQPSVPAALAAVRSGDADAALVPLENSVEGSVPATMDGLADGDPLVITREVFLDVAFVAGRAAGHRRSPTSARWPAIRTRSRRRRDGWPSCSRTSRRCR